MRRSSSQYSGIFCQPFPVQLELLIDVVLVSVRIERAIARAVGRQHIDPRAGKQLAQFARLRLIGHRMDPDARRHPTLQQHVAALEDEPQLLAVHPARLMKAVIEVEMHAAWVAHGALHLVLAAVGPATGLRGDDFAGAQPTGQHVEEVHAVLDEDSAALFAVPEPVLRRQILVGRVVLEVTVQQFAERSAFDDLADDVEQRVVSLHQVRDEQPILSPRERHQLVGLFDRQRERLLADDVLARFECHLGLLVMQKRRRGDVDEVDRRQVEQPIDVDNVLEAVTLRRRQRGRPRGAGHSGQPHAGDLHELLQREQAEAAAADHADTEVIRLVASQCHRHHARRVVPRRITRGR